MRTLTNVLVESIRRTASDPNAIALQLRAGTEGGPWGGGGWGFGFLWPLFWLLVLGVLVGVIVYLLARGNDDTNADRALVVLRERYARGEIGEDEFEERASRLRNPP